ncbi:hypothetical protein DFJ74DRAFT_686694 [Hyaloraphidium curvatum]|nr:hypothetical protein DFJ74DRAFT_686694 [Hyaloraphidium curvatum]
MGFAGPALRVLLIAKHISAFPPRVRLCHGGSAHSDHRTRRHASANMSVLAQKVAAGLWGVWGFLHIWVPYDGWKTYHGEGLKGQWHAITGGADAPRSELGVTGTNANALSSLMLNFVNDVGGYGILGLVLARRMWIKPRCWFRRSSIRPR